MHMSTTNMFLI